MRTVELAGAVGSGKSTLAPELVRLLTQGGVDAIGQADAIAELAGRRVRMTVDVPHGAAFAARHPRLVWLVARHLRRAAIDWSHRRRIMGLVLRLGARRRFLDERLPGERVVVLDEGFVQRMVNVFAWRPGAIATGDLERYLRLAPIADVVVVVRTDPGVATARARSRGLPARVQARPADDAARFLGRAGEVIDRAVPLLVARGVHVLEVDNNGTPAEAIDGLRGVATSLASTAPVTTPLARLGMLVLPRPRRMRASHGRGVADRGTLATVMDAYGIAAWRVVRPLGRATGRSGSVLVATSEEMLVVKRYKPTVEIGQVRVEHAILAELEARSFPAPRLRRTSEGRTIIETDAAAYAAFAFVAGYRRSDDVLLPHGVRRDPIHGATLGALHAALGGFVPEGSSPHGLASADGGRTRDLAWHLELVERIERHPDLDRGTRGELAEVRATLPRLDAQLDAATLSRGVVHGDFGPYNLLVRDGAPILIVDFELARLDWRVVDLATALPRYGRGEGRRAEHRMRSFLDGYRSRIELPARDLEAIPVVLAFLSLRRAVVCLARWQEARSGTLRAEATQKLMLARTALRADQPIARVSGLG